MELLLLYSIIPTWFNEPVITYWLYNKQTETKSNGHFYSRLLKINYHLLKNDQTEITAGFFNN